MVVDQAHVYKTGALLHLSRSLPPPNMLLLLLLLLLLLSHAPVTINAGAVVATAPQERRDGAAPDGDGDGDEGERVTRVTAQPR